MQGNPVGRSGWRPRTLDLDFCLVLAANGRRHRPGQEGDVGSTLLDLAVNEHRRHKNSTDINTFVFVRQSSSPQPACSCAALGFGSARLCCMYIHLLSPTSSLPGCGTL